MSRKLTKKPKSERGTVAHEASKLYYKRGGDDLRSHWVQCAIMYGIAHECSDGTLYTTMGGNKEVWYAAIRNDRSQTILDVINEIRRIGDLRMGRSDRPWLRYPRVKYYAAEFTAALSAAQSP